MPAELMDGRKVSELLRPQLLAHARELAERHRVVPALAAIMVGDNAASA
jgi:5,10-methylene-tetrahydrofolate dehydrogenase/methenyl tetrahydrofolate cyclohydrolase